MEIISNGVPRPMIPFYALPPKVQAKVRDNYENADQFDWVQYKGEWYCTEDFMIAPESLHKEGWGGYVSETFFSGVVVRLVDDGERLVFGRYFS